MAKLEVRERIQSRDLRDQRDPHHHEPKGEESEPPFPSHPAVEPERVDPEVLHSEARRGGPGERRRRNVHRFLRSHL